MPLKIGLTGGIGSGKSTVARIFQILGVPVYYADQAAKKLLNENESLRKAVIEKFGQQSYKDGTLNRSYLAAMVFDDKQKLEQLNAIVHPATIADGNDWMVSQKSRYAIKEAALIFETGLHEHLDYVVGVSAPDPLRILRAMKRDHITRQDVLARMQRQLDQQVKMRLCDFVIINDEQQPVIPQVLELHQQLLKLSNE